VLKAVQAVKLQIPSRPLLPIQLLRPEVKIQKIPDIIALFLAGATTSCTSPGCFNENMCCQYWGNFYFKKK
jgi:hypothetical protein